MARDSLHGRDPGAEVGRQRHVVLEDRGAGPLLLNSPSRQPSNGEASPS